MRSAYLDNAATTLRKPAAVAAAVKKAIDNLASPGRGGYAQSNAAAETVFECRQRAANMFGVSEPEHVVFTMNATHGLNIAIKSLCSPGDRVVVSGYEHNAVMRPLHALGVKTTTVVGQLFDKEEILMEFTSEIDSETAAVICTHVSNVFGAEMPIYEIADICREKNVPLIIDASQSAGSHCIDMEKLGAAFIAMPGHKGLYGPQGTGLLLCCCETETLLEGGTGSDSRKLAMPLFLPDRLEAGTINAAGIAGLNEGLKYVEKLTPSRILDHEKRLISYILENIRTDGKVEVFTGDGHDTGVLSMRFKNMDNESVAQMMAEEGIAVRAGMHCAPLAHRSAGTLDSGTVRVSVSAMTDKKEVVKFLRFVNKL